MTSFYVIQLYKGQQKTSFGKEAGLNLEIIFIFYSKSKLTPFSKKV